MIRRFPNRVIVLSQDRNCIVKAVRTLFINTKSVIFNLQFLIFNQTKKFFIFHFLNNKNLLKISNFKLKILFMDSVRIVIAVQGAPGELKHLSILRKRNTIEIPSVAASERGRA